MKLYEASGVVAAAGSFSPASFYVQPEDKRVYVEMIVLGWQTGTTGRATINLIVGGVETPLIDDYPLAADDQIVTIYPQIHLEKGMGLSFVIANAGAADIGKVTVLGVR